MQIHFFDEKFISTTKKNVDLFYFDEKLRSTSKKDVDPFYFDEKLRSTSKKDVDPFYLYIYIYIKNQFSTCRSLKVRNKLQ